MSGVRTFGVDEAGRGPILGPMAIAVVAIDRRTELALRRAGVQDSKGFGVGPQAVERRAELAEQIKRRAHAWACELVAPDEIDRWTFQGRLNALERTVVTRLLEHVGAGREHRIVCDGQNLFHPLRGRFPRLIACDRAESSHVAVAAASIVAKDARDTAFSQIAARYREAFGEIRGGGYVNAGTRAFLDRYAERHGDLPPEARRSWGADKSAQLSLLDDPAFAAEVVPRADALRSHTRIRRASVAPE